MPSTVAEGPGKRFGIWVQGCSIRCDGCFNPHFWSPAGGRLLSVSELVGRAVSADVEGVTLLGGEPFDQAAEVAELSREVRSAGLSVMTFTGYVREDLESRGDAATIALLAATDLLVDGPYRADDRDLVRPWVGSTNQRFHFLSDRYKHLEFELSVLPDRLEVRVSRDGTVEVNGWATVDQLDALLEDQVPAIKRGRVR